MELLTPNLYMAGFDMTHIWAFAQGGSGKGVGGTPVPFQK